MRKVSGTGFYGMGRHKNNCKMGIKQNGIGMNGNGFARGSCQGSGTKYNGNGRGLCRLSAEDSPDSLNRVKNILQKQLLRLEERLKNFKEKE